MFTVYCIPLCSGEIVVNEVDPLETSEFSESVKTKKIKQEGDILYSQYILILGFLGATRPSSI